MIRKIIHDPMLLSMKSSEASKEDIQTASDLADTLRANADKCVGMAANMTGVRKRIIVFFDGGIIREMFNPGIISAKGEFETEEGCLSLPGVRKTKRYHTITVRWQDRQFVTHTDVFTGFTAQIIQHEIDHCNGKLI